MLKYMIPPSATAFLVDVAIRSVATLTKVWSTHAQDIVVTSVPGTLQGGRSTKVPASKLTVTLCALTATLACSHAVPYRSREIAGIATRVDRSVESPLYRILLIGDAGEPGPEAAALLALRAWVEDAPDRTLVTFLGDNAYPEGLTRTHRLDAERSLLRQLQVVDDTPATALFIPGNHDWAGGGSEGLDAVLAQAEFLRGRARFLPSNGCPGPELVDVPESEPLVRVVVLDTQWWLHDERKPTDTCDPGTRAAVAQALRAAVDTPLPIVVAGHHPLASHGPHGGFFDWRAHVFPLTELAQWLRVPLPVVGSIYPLARSIIPGDQELSNAENRGMREALAQALGSRTRRGPVLYAAGHEHSLQVLRGVAVDYVLVSGAGSRTKITAVGSGPDTMFAHEHTGFMALDVGEAVIRLSVVEPTVGGAGEVVFSLEIPLSSDSVGN